MTAQLIINLIIALLGPIEQLLAHPQAPTTSSAVLLRHALIDFRENHTPDILPDVPVQPLKN